MKKFLFFLTTALLISAVGGAQALLTLSGHVYNDASGNPVSNHQVIATISGGGITQSYDYTTNNSGFYVDSIPVFAQGTILVSTIDCNGIVHSFTDNFYVGNYTFSYDFYICVDSTNTGCEANFSYATSPAGAVMFTDLSTGDPTYWFWDFGDGNYSNEQNPVHFYNALGPFYVCLTIVKADSSCNDTYCQNVYPNGGGSGCTNSFSYTAPNMIDFTFFGESQPVPADNYFWDFGDGQTGSGQTVTHSYNVPGTQVFSVTLTTILFDPQTGDSCLAFSSQQVIAGGQNGNCQNWFESVSNDNLTFNFTGHVSPPVQTIYSWNFGDGATGMGQQITHTFQPNGIAYYIVCLTTYSIDSTYDTCVADTCQPVYVGSQGGCSNWFWYNNPTTFHFEFHGESYPSPASEYHWDFGDGTTGAGQVVQHNYEPNTGNFQVTLTTIVFDPAAGDSCVANSSQDIWVGGQSGDCLNWFWYEAQPGGQYVFHGESSPVPADQYIWQFDNGSIQYGQDVTHTFDPSQGNEHLVCLTTFVFNQNADSCSYTSCQQVITGGMTGSQLMGTIYTNDTIPADFALVGLFGMQPDGSFTYDFTVTEQGMYLFDNVQPGDYYIFASLTPQSQSFYDYFQTYYGNAVTWSGATLITLGEPQNPYNINLVPIQGVTSGPGMINGNIIWGNEKDDPGANITVILMDENENVLTFTQSNDEGLFSFENLAYGIYKLKVEIPGKSSAVATIDLLENDPEGAVTFVVKETEVVLNSGELPAFLKFAGEIFPNPVTCNASLELSLIKPSNLTITVLNQLGQRIQSKKEFLTGGDHLIGIETSDLSSGFYTLKITDSAGGTLVKKFIK